MGKVEFAGNQIERRYACLSGLWITISWSLRAGVSSYRLRRHSLLDDYGKPGQLSVFVARNYGPHSE